MSDLTPLPTTTGAIRTVPHAQLATDVRQGVLRLSRRLRQQKADTHVSDAQGAALGYIVANEPLSIGELSEHEGVTPPSMNRTVNALVELGLVERGTDDADRRKVVLRATQAGASFILETRRRRDEWLVPRLAKLTPDERKTLADATRILRELARS
ncbi:MarR family winged helix-turn-helix transcriptional regulator [Frondihabitans australicus]|uniref:MarR family transcriptional regulator n=1 Tax=Frondihabitans australicus TaxID=386892 RepID=A0A495ILD9_9MICO|nr:MarR family transcriptional regulator [Frondihabitans australicus]RKR76248.1 MarR family transcriptional regulator [Frondihabitans australicus]